jgi:uncharacterized protein (TIGR00255 family)
MKSMTGFGKSEGDTRYGRVIAEARSENHRFLDIKFMLPDSISPIEPELTETVKKLILRGKLRITISIEGTKAAAPVLNIDLARQFRKSIESLKKEMGIKEELRLEHFLMIKDIFSTKTAEHLTSEDISDIERILSKAVQKLDEARKSEGKKLEKDFRERLDKIDGLTRSITAKRKDFMESSSLKLRERISKILEDSQIDEARLYQEAAFLTERSDITEELVRLKAHIGKFRETLRNKGSIGKELDFLLQEMNREAGTIAAKAKDAEISHFTIELRSELEKIREQLQNIE